MRSRRENDKNDGLPSNSEIGFKINKMNEKYLQDKAIEDMTSVALSNDMTYNQYKVKHSDLSTKDQNVYNQPDKETNSVYSLKRFKSYNSIKPPTVQQAPATEIFSKHRREVSGIGVKLDPVSSNDFQRSFKISTPRTGMERSFKSPNLSFMNFPQ